MGASLNDNDLNQVNGGATVTPYGNIINDDGSVTMTDKTGAVHTFSKSEWEKLKNYYSYTGEAERYIKDVNIPDLVKYLYNN
ncbi:MAG: hypothetical protein K6B28_09640 [Lachnospiraceae bacterium]|nr:hypothetical protein [Lachnospiraceae bacterium]